LWCLKNSRNPEQLVAQIGRWGELVRQVMRAPDGMAAFEMIFRYIWVVNEKLGVEELRQLVEREVGKDVEEALVNSVDMLRAEGRSEGQREMLVRLLGKRFGALPEEAAARINAAEPAQLEAWFDRVLTAPTLADVLGDG
jgi:hypothetical protein